MHSIKKVHMDFTLEIVNKVFYAWHHSLDAKHHIRMEIHVELNWGRREASSSLAINTQNKTIASSYKQTNKHTVSYLSRSVLSIIWLPFGSKIHIRRPYRNCIFLLNHASSFLADNWQHSHVCLCFLFCFVHLSPFLLILCLNILFRMENIGNQMCDHLCILAWQNMMNPGESGQTFFKL